MDAKTLAISKLKTEMEKNKNNPCVQVVGEFLLRHLEQNPQDAEKIAAADKTIEKSLGEMRKVAETKKVGNCAVLTDQEGFAIVLKYFGIESPGAIQTADPVPSKPANGVEFDINLDDLL